MMVLKSRYLVVFLTVILLAVLSGCNSDGNKTVDGENKGKGGNDKNGGTNEETVTIKIARFYESDEAWENRIGILEKDLPNIKFERIQYENTSFEFPQNAETQAEKQECNVVAAFLSRVIV